MVIVFRSIRTWNDVLFLSSASKKCLLTTENVGEEQTETEATILHGEHRDECEIIENLEGPTRKCSARLME